MKLYYSKGACSLVVRIILNELQIPCDYEAVNLKNKQTESGRDFITINPKGSVPVLECENHEILTENAVILQYLADDRKATHLLPPVGDFKRYRVLEWLNYITTEMHKGFAPIFNPAISKTSKDHIFMPMLKLKFSFVNAHLQHHTYLLGDDFTLPDAYLFVVSQWMTHFNVDMKQWSHLMRYLEMLKERPSIQQSLQQEK